MPRQEFTDEEDQLLIKYLAKYTPGGSGRRGNKVYHTLTENAANKWSWSTAHSWQSWRNRYMKDQEYFDARILRYQKKHQYQEVGHTDPSMAGVREKIMEKLKHPKKQTKEQPVSEEEAEEDAENGNDAAPNSTEQPQEYESVKEDDDDLPEAKPNSEAGSTTEDRPTVHVAAPEPANDPEARQASPLPQADRKLPVLKKRKRLQSGNIDDSDVFGSFPPSPHSSAFSPLPISRAARPPPRYVRGHFSSTLTDSMGMIRATRTYNTSDTSTDNDKRKRRKKARQPPWPPRRTRGQTTETGVTSESRLQAPSSNVDRGIQTSDVDDEPTPKPLKTKTPVRSVRIASLPILAVSPPPMQDLGEELSSPLQDLDEDASPPFMQDLDEEHGHHPFSQPSQFPRAPFSPSSESDSHHPFSQPTQAMDEPIGTTENADLGHLSTKPVPTGDNSASRRHVRAASLDFIWRHTAHPSESRKRETSSSDQQRSREGSSLALYSRENLTRNLFKSHTAIRRASGDFGYGSARIVTSNSSDEMHTPHATTSAKSTTEPKANSTSAVLMAALDQGSRRRTFGGFTSLTTNSGTTHQAGQSRASLPESSRIPSHSRQSSREIFPANVSSRDHTMDDDDLRFAIKEMSKNQGFQESVTWRVWRACGNLRKVDQTLKGMRELAQTYFNQVLGPESGEEAEEHGLWMEGRDSPRSADTFRRSSVLGPSPRGHVRVDRRFTPVPIRGDLDVEYTPPEASRAGQLTKLGHRGVIDDGVTRDAGSAGSSPLKDKPIARVSFSKSPQRHAFDAIEGTLESMVKDPTDRSDRIPVWAEKEDAALLNGNAVALGSVEQNMERHSVRTRTMQALKSLGIL